MTDETQRTPGDPAPDRADAEVVEVPVAPAAGEELVIVDGQVRADFPPPPPGAQWSTFGLDAAAPPPKRGLFASLAIVLLAITAWTILGTGAVTSDVGAALLVASWSTVAVLAVGAIALRSRWFGITVTAVTLLAHPLAGLTWLLVAAAGPAERSALLLSLLLNQAVLTIPVILGLVAALRPRRPLRGLQVIALSIAGAVILWAAVWSIGRLIDAEPASPAAVWGGTFIMLAAPAAAILVGFRHRISRFAGAAVIALALPMTALPGPGGWDPLQLLVVPVASAAAWCATVAARRTVDEPSYGQQSDITL